MTYPPPYHIPEMESREWQDWLHTLKDILVTEATLDFYRVRQQGTVRCFGNQWTTVVSTGDINIIKRPLAIIIGHSYLTGFSGISAGDIKHRITRDGAQLHERLYNRVNIEYFDDTAAGEREYAVQRWVGTNPASWADYAGNTLTVYSI